MSRNICLLVLLTVFVWEGNAQPNSVAVISIKAIAGLKYDQVRFRVRPGATIRIVFYNADEMSHNLVITSPGAREEIVKAANDLGEKGPGMNYIPVTSKVLWSIPILEPGQSRSITITAPQSIGVYPYVCTFPGHGYVMFGAMYVTDKGMPPLKDDPNVPPIQNESAGSATPHDHQSRHPYHPTPPFLYRIFMPDAGPAAIAVSLPNQLSFCWDAGACRLRYAWQGDFLDPLDYWNKKAEPYAKISGKVFFRDKTQFPIRMGAQEKIPVVDFKGYRLVKSYPEFHYTLDGVEVFELIQPKADGTGLERTFRIPNAKENVWFVFDANDGVQYTSSLGKLNINQFMLSPNEAKQFKLTMTMTEPDMKKL